MKKFQNLKKGKKMSEIYEKSTEIIFVRHGQTDFNKQRLYFGHLDPKLNETGISQLKNTKKLLHKLEKNISKVYSSDLKRCVESMKLLEIDAEVEKILTEDLREMNFGVLEGKTFEEAKEEFPGFVENLKNNWKKLRFDGSESVEDLYFRVSDKLSKIAEENKGEKILVVAHAGVIQSLLSYYLFDSLDGYWKFKIDNGSISKLHITSDGFAYFEYVNRVLM